MTLEAGTGGKKIATNFNQETFSLQEFTKKLSHVDTPRLSNFYTRVQFPLNIWVPSINCFVSEQKGTISSPWFLSFHTWGVSLWDEKGETIKFLLTGAWIHRHTQTPLLCSRDLGAYISRGGRTAYSKTSLGGQKVPSPSSFIPPHSVGPFLSQSFRPP